MDNMQMKLGAHIAALRKACGMTQEQLAAAVGVSPPAVSKWETDASCPDIALLCPLARALHTNVDTLLLFEDTLSDEQITTAIDEVVMVARNQDLPRAEQMLRELLHAYPSCAALKYNAAMALNVFVLFSPAVPEAKRSEWRGQKKRLLEDLYRSGASPYWQNAVNDLASIALQEDRLDLADQLLKELPERSVDATMLRTLLYLKQGDRDQALAVTQKRLYVLVHHVQTCLILLMDEKMQPDADKVLTLSRIYCQIEDLFGVGGGLGIGHLAEAYRRMGQMDKALEIIVQLIDRMVAPLKMPNPLLFSPSLKTDEAPPAAGKEVKEMLLQSLLTDEAYAGLHGEKAFQDAVEKLRSSIQNS